MPTGLGFAPLGSSICGYGVLDQANQPLADLYVDSADGVGKGARRISSATGQYVFRSNGKFDGMNGVQQLVLLRAKTLLNSSGVLELGIGKIPEVKGRDLEKALEARVNAAMQDLYDAGIIRSEGVVVDRNAKPVIYVFYWKDLTTETENRTVL